MLDPKEHYIDPRNGFARHKQTGHLIGIEPAPPPKHPEEGAAYPKWVPPHPGHVQRLGDRVSTPHFADFHVDRADNVTVLVKNAEEEAFALVDPAHSAR